MPPRSTRVAGWRKRMRWPASISIVSPGTGVLSLARPAGSGGSSPACCRSGATVTSKAPRERRLRSTAVAITSQVHGSTRTGRVTASQLSRLTSLTRSWKLIRRWTFAIAANAASAAASRSHGSAPLAVISTKVPSSGRARRTCLAHIPVGKPASSPDRVGGRLSPQHVRSADAMTVEPEDLLHAFGHVMGRERRARDVAYVVVDRERARTGLADELRQPARPADLAAVGFAILQDIDAMDAAARIERHRIVDVEMLADDAVEHEQSDHLAAGLRL